MSSEKAESTIEPCATSFLSSSTLNAEEEKLDEHQNVQCLCCNQFFDFKVAKDDYLAHLFLSHRLVIADVEDIADLQKYFEYWVKYFKDHELEQFCTTLLLDQLPDGTPSKNEKYYLLSDVLPQDCEIRKQLHIAKLQQVLQQYQFERTDRSFHRECLYCRDVIKGLRSDYIEHLYKKHFLQMGKPENLVFIDELIQIVQDKLNNLVCLYCEKLFKDRVTLKEHMRKKGHKRINPNIKLYDKFFLVNYKTEKPQHIKNIRNRKPNRQINYAEKSNVNDQNRKKLKVIYRKDTILNSDDDDSDWSDWDEEKTQLICLFCLFKETNFPALNNHMKTLHQLDFEQETKNLSFYQKVKIVNYIRRKVGGLRCVICNERSKSLEDLQNHMKESKHYGIGEKKQWDQPEYFFPTYEDDGILCLLDDEQDFTGDDVVIISEDIKVSINKEAEALSLENFVL